MNKALSSGLRLLALGATVFLVACSANHKSIFRHQSLENTDPASITLVDAKQRAILAAPKDATGIKRFCAEPSPDVFAVIAQSLSAGGSFGQQADPKAIQAALNAAFASSEQASTIPRTQTINMLRELMYRTCERYLNDGISSLELPLQAIRDQRLMVSILAIEQLTGAVATKAVALGAAAEAAAGASTAGGMAVLEKARGDLKGKATALAEAKTEVDGVTAKVEGKEVKACDVIADAETDEAKAALAAEVKAKEAECTEKKEALSKAQAEHKEAKAYYDKQSKLADAASIPVSAAATLATPTALGGIDKAGGGTMGDVASTVQAIVKMNFDQDEFLFLCLKLSDQKGKDSVDAKVADDVKVSCIKYFNALIAAKAQKQNEEAARSELFALQVKEESTLIQQSVTANFETLWSRIKKDENTADADKVKKLRGDGAGWPACFDRAAVKSDYANCFNGLKASERKTLLNKASTS